ncbi:MAG TPA: GNAT family protein [Bryobacteraceae bacterium]|nr:GNAT family protein [Bryobacteraceae bacterium]
MIVIRPVRQEDADELFPQVFRSPVTATLAWDGPGSREEYQANIAEFAEKTRAGLIHMFTIVESGSGGPVGNIDVRPYADGYRADIGLWIGQAYHGKGYGTAAISLAVEYGFERVQLQKIEARVFVGNHASRRAFEKNGFVLEGTVRRAIRKRGQFVDEWLMGVLPEEFRRFSPKSGI